MPSLRPIPRSRQRDEAWANGRGTTTVILREPDDADWTVRVSVARVDGAGPFSELRDTRRLLVPLDAPMTLRFPDARETTAPRFGVLCFEGAPAPEGLLPEGPTRDFNLMLRNGARGELWPRTLANSMLLPHAPGDRWLVYLDSGRARLQAGGETELELDPGDAALVAGTDETEHHARIQGAGEIILVKLYA